MKKTRMPLPAALDRQTTPRISAFSRGPLAMRMSTDRRCSFFRVFLRTVLLVGLCGVLMGTLVLTASGAMVGTTREQITSVEALEGDLVAGEFDCILVLGAGVRADGTPSDMLRDRVTVACDIYDAAGNADVPLLMSGDHTGDYNEVGVMKGLAVEKGIPSERIFLDHEGYSTYESVYRAKFVFGAKKVVIVTQEYHLHRALHIARELGMEAVGISADLRPYRKQGSYEIREILARYKDMLAAAEGGYDGHLDPPVDLDGDGNMTN